MCLVILFLLKVSLMLVLKNTLKRAQRQKLKFFDFWTKAKI